MIVFLLMGMLIGFASASSVDKELPSRDIQSLSMKEFNSMGDNSDMILVKGYIPETKTNSERVEWADKMCNIRENISADLSQFTQKNGGPIISYSSYSHYIEIGIGMDEKYTDEDLTSIYEAVEKNANKAGITNVPVVFRLTSGLTMGGFVELDDNTTIDEYLSENSLDNLITLANTPEDTYSVSGLDSVNNNILTTSTPIIVHSRPVVGGILHMIRENANSYGFGTIGFAAERNSDGAEGYIVAKHLTPSLNIPSYQPYYDSSNDYSAGTVDDMSSSTADTSFVEYSNVAGQIYSYNIYDEISVDGYYSTPMTQWTVYKNGAMTGYSSGTVVAVTDWTCEGVDLTDTVKTNIQVAQIDSGCPLWAEKYGRTKLVGTLIGFDDSGYSYYNSIGTIMDELDVEPLED